MGKNEQSKAVLPLIEMTIALSVLAICSVITVSLFLYAHFAGEASMDMNSALMLAQTQAEKIHNLKGRSLEDISLKEIPKAATIGYDEFWQETIENPVFTMKLSYSEEKGINATMISARITVEKVNKYPFLSEERKKLAELSAKAFCPGKGGFVQ